MWVNLISIWYGFAFLLKLIGRRSSLVDIKLFALGGAESVYERNRISEYLHIYDIFFPFWNYFSLLKQQTRPLRCIFSFSYFAMVWSDYRLLQSRVPITEISWYHLIDGTCNILFVNIQPPTKEKKFESLIHHYYIDIESCRFACRPRPTIRVDLKHSRVNSCAILKPLFTLRKENNLDRKSVV